MADLFLRKTQIAGSNVIKHFVGRFGMKIRNPRLRNGYGHGGRRRERTLEQEEEEIEAGALRNDDTNSCARKRRANSS